MTSATLQQFCRLQRYDDRGDFAPQQGNARSVLRYSRRE
jgi:hypothetical protein